MPAPQEHWRKLPPQVIAAYSPEAVNDAIYAALTSLTYYDGAARVPGADSAVLVEGTDVEGTTKAVYGTFAGGLAGVKWMFSGSNAGAAPAMLSPDTYAAGRVMGSLWRGAGAFSDWQAAPPFAGASGPGAINYGNSKAGVLSLQAYESETQVLVVVATAAGSVMGCILGQGVDTDSADPLDGETAAGGDGTLLWQANLGGNGFGAGWVLQSNWQSDPSGDRMFLQDDNSADGCRVRTFSPTTGTGVRSYRNGTNFQGTLEGIKPSGALAMQPFHIIRASDSRFLGRMREVYLSRNAVNNTVLQSGGTDIGYFVSASVVADAAAIFLRY